MNRRNILIVEDEFIVAADIKVTLERRGFAVVHITDTGHGAVEYMREKGDLDCIIMDVSLKGDYSGIEATEEIHKEHSVPVIFLTAHNTLPGIRDGLRSPLCRLVAKPFDETELVEAIETSMKSQRAGEWND